MRYVVPGDTVTTFCLSWKISVPVVICEWHVVEVLTQTLLQAYEAGWD